MHGKDVGVVTALSFSLSPTRGAFIGLVGRFDCSCYAELEHKGHVGMWGNCEGSVLFYPPNRYYYCKPLLRF